MLPIVDMIFEVSAVPPSEEVASGERYSPEDLETSALETELISASKDALVTVVILEDNDLDEDFDPF